MSWDNERARRDAHLYPSQSATPPGHREEPDELPMDQWGYPIYDDSDRAKQKGTSDD